MAALGTVLANCPVVLWSVDRDGKYLMCEGKGLDAIGLKPRELIGLSLFEFTAENPVIAERTRRALQGEVITAEDSFRGRWYETHYSPLTDPTGQIIGVVGVSNDITSRKEAERLTLSEQAAREASRLKSDFLATMSHEIRTPLNGIVGVTSLMLETTLTREQREYAEIIERSADTLLAVVNDILDFSKVEAGKLEIELSDFDPEQLADDIQKTFIHAARKQVITLRADTVALPRLVRGDPARVRQVLNNLIANAIKFTHEGGVTLRINQESSNAEGVVLRFTVTDTGVGITNEAKARLFRPFAQGEASIARKYGGTGLGLSISKQLVELMGGRIDFSSTEGQGSSFWFTLPFTWGAQPVQSRGQRTSIFARRERSEARILVAEDNYVNQHIALKMLDRLGFRADAVADGNEALRALRETHYDAVLMDCQMPELDGYAATIAIRNHTVDSIRNIPVIAMTANALKGDREKCLAAGMTDYLTKPLRAEKLAETLDRWILLPAPEASSTEFAHDPSFDPIDFDTT